MEIVSRKEAENLGVDYYFTGRPCLRNHVSKRLVSNGTCYQCILDRNKNYQEKNKEKIKDYKASWYQENKDRVSKTGKNWRENNPDKIKSKNQAYRSRKGKYYSDYMLKRLYGLSREEYETLLTTCDGKCQICKRSESRLTKSGNQKALAVDHSHVTGEVRGILCQDCNIALGLFKDDMILLESALEYLRAK